MGDDNHKKVLRRHLVDLLDRIWDPISLTDHLYSATEQFTVGDKELVACKQTRVDRNRELINILSHKDKQLYIFFIVALAETGQDYLIPRLRKEEVLVSLEKFLIINYKKKFGEEVHFDVINKRFEHTHKEDITDEEFVKTTASTFPEIRYDKETKYFKNLTHCDTSHLPKDHQYISKENMADDEVLNQISIDVLEWGEEDVTTWLQEVGMPSEVVEKFRSLQIDGESLLELTENHLEREIPELVLGRRLKFLKRRKDLIEGKYTLPSEKYLKGTSPSVILTRNTRLETIIPDDSKIESEKRLQVTEQLINVSKSDTEIEDNTAELHCISDTLTTQTLHSVQLGNTFESCGTLEKDSKYEVKLNNEEKNFSYSTDLSVEIDEIDLCRSLIKFICACLNHRVNGKFVIGLDKDYRVIGCQLPKSPQLLASFFQSSVEKAFGEKKDIVSKCVKVPKFKDVIPNEESRYVCELEIIPQHGLCKTHVFHVKLPKSNQKKSKKTTYTFVDDTIKNLGKEDIRSLKQNIGEIDMKRKRYDMTKEEQYESKGTMHVTETSQSREPSIVMNAEAFHTELNTDKQSTCVDNNDHQDANSDIRAIDWDGGECESVQDNRYKMSEKEKVAADQFTADKLMHLLSLGDNSTVNDLYPILVTTALEDTGEIDDLGFIGQIPWKVVFDFSSDDKLMRLFEHNSQVDTKIIPTADDFNTKSHSHMKHPEKLKSLFDDIELSLNAHFNQFYTGPHWVFANNEMEDSLPILQHVEMWNREQRFGLKEAISLYDNLIPRGRAVVVFLALSENTSIMIEAMTEFISAFQDQWVLIASNGERIANPIMDELLRRSFLKEDNLRRRSVINLPWNNVQSVVSHIYSVKISDTSNLCCATGDFVTVTQKWKNSLSDLEIISANEYDDLELNKIQDVVEQEEQKYYNGAEVSWLNFKAETHVCQRQALYDIKHFVGEALKPGFVDETYIGKVVLYHQPGAGGTTVARNVLWDFKDKYRCAVVKNISDQTAHQIMEYRSYNDVNPKPVLILMDNMDEEPSNVLVAQLEEMSKQVVRSEENNDGNTPVCVFLICWRKTLLPPQTIQLSAYNQAYKCSLGHHLTSQEKRWWTKKYQELEERTKTCPKHGQTLIHPNLLISFNIMKSNFNKNVIKRMVTNLVRKIDHPTERKLLKFVALLNAFDVNFRPIPSSSFDFMMIEFTSNGASKRKSTKGKKNSKNLLYYESGGPSGVFGLTCSSIRSWLSKLSQEFRLLMNDPSPFSKKAITNLRITNPLLSQEVLSAIRELEGNTQTISTMALQLLECNEIFNVKGIARNKIIQVVVDIVKRRERPLSGKVETYFAPMIQYIVEHEDVERASRVMEKVFEISQDAYIAQHIARINIYSQNWTKAITYANKATHILPESSILWDTCGRIYQRRLVEQHKILSSSTNTEYAKVAELIDIAHTGINHFYKAQEISEREKYGFQSNFGYLGQLEITQLLFLCLSKIPCFHSKGELTQFLLDKNVPAQIRDLLLDSGDGEGLLSNLREIVGGVEKAIRKLEDERTQLKDPVYLDEYRSRNDSFNHDRLDEVKANLYDILQEEDDMLTEALPPNDACRARSRQIRALGGNSFWSIFDLVGQSDGMDRLSKIKCLCLKNLSTKLASAEDYETLIGACLALVQCGTDVVYYDLVEWSKILYKIRDTIQSGKIHLEPYLFFVMFNWPRENSGTCYVPNHELQDAMEKWKIDYFLKYPKQKNSERKGVTKEGTTVYFFARGQGISSIFKAADLRKNLSPYSKGEAFWKEEAVLETLQRFDGVLTNEGEEVNITVKYPSGDKATITIPTSLPKKNRKLWYKRVYFAIGFTWIGPKAFDVRKEDPTAKLNLLKVPDHSTLREKDRFGSRHKESQRSNKRTYYYLLNELTDIEVLLTTLKEKKQKKEKITSAEEKELAYLRRKRERLMEQSHQIMERLEYF